MCQENTSEEYRAGNVVFVIITNGEESSSREYSAEKVEGMVGEEKRYGWEFVLLRANIDAVGTQALQGVRLLLLFAASAAFAAQSFCGVTASILSSILFLRLTPRLLDTQCGVKG